MRTRAHARLGYILLVVAVLTLLAALPVAAAEPPDLQFEPVPDSESCPYAFFGGARTIGRCPGEPGGPNWLW